MEIALIVVTAAAIGLLLWDQKKRADQPTPAPVRRRPPAVRVIPPVFDQDRAR